MKIAKLEQNSGKIFVEIPLTEQSSKARVKIRNSFYEYGLPSVTKQSPFTQKHYIEWQIGYDVDKNDRGKLDLSTCKDTEFIGANDNKKALYELSEFIYYFTKWGIITNSDIEKVEDFIQKNKNQFITNSYKIHTQAMPPYFDCFYASIFSLRTINFPYLIWQYPNESNCKLSIEIIIKNQQRGTQTQPMLYVCFPITQLCPTDGNSELLDRKAQEKEKAHLILDSTHKQFLLESFKIFGILSPNHNHDVREILKIIKA